MAPYSLPDCPKCERRWAAIAAAEDASRIADAHRATHGDDA